MIGSALGRGSLIQVFDEHGWAVTGLMILAPIDVTPGATNPLPGATNPLEG